MDAKTKSDSNVPKMQITLLGCSQEAQKERGEMNRRRERAPDRRLSDLRILANRARNPMEVHQSAVFILPGGPPNFNRKGEGKMEKNGKKQGEAEGQV